jgi:hypothetical protein
MLVGLTIGLLALGGVGMPDVATAVTQRSLTNGSSSTKRLPSPSGHRPLPVPYDRS